MLVNFSPHPAHVQNWVGSGWAANNDKLSIPAIILTIIIALVYFIQWWRWAPWADCKVAEGGTWKWNLCRSSVWSHFPSCSPSLSSGPGIVSALHWLTECNAIHNKLVSIFWHLGSWKCDFFDLFSPTRRFLVFHFTSSPSLPPSPSFFSSCLSLFLSHQTICLPYFFFQSCHLSLFYRLSYLSPSFIFFYFPFLLCRCH